MQRILLIFAFVIAAGVVSVAVVELNHRTTGSSSALPTPRVPTPSAAPAPTPKRTAQATAEPTREPSATTAATEAAPAPSPTSTRAPTTTTPATPTPTVEPPATPSPSPALTAGPIDTSRGPTPHTGGGAGNGVVIAALALAARFGLNRRRRT